MSSILTHLLLLTLLTLIAIYLRLYGEGDENSGGLPQDKLDAFSFKSIKGDACQQKVVRSAYVLTVFNIYSTRPNS